MSKVSTSVYIDAPSEAVWEVLADLGGISRWNPGVAQSRVTSERADGEGATRHCDLQNPRGYLEERAFNWRDGEGYSIDVTKSNFPIKRNVVDFSIHPESDGTRAIVSVDYELRYGPIGVLADALLVRRQYRRGFNDLLAGLKYYVETGEVVDDWVPSVSSV
jgi:uncharacterized protein YndB with AHSA1/START domain